MGAYSKARLEGRALEHALSQDAGYCIRMGDESGQFQNVRGAEAKEIRISMEKRVKTLLTELAVVGLHRTGGESPVTLPDGTNKSVDFRCWFSPRAENCLIEVKWTRQNLTTAWTAAKRSFSWLKLAAEGGAWMRSRKKVSAALVGAIAVGPSHWMCELRSVKGSWSVYLSDTEEPPAAIKKTKRKSRSGCYKRRGNPTAQAVEAKWRKSAQGRALQKRLNTRYRATDKGKKNVKLHNAKKTKKDQRQ